MTMSFHPLADIFPLIEGRDFDDLVADIEANGLRENITILDGSILDGRNRYRAALACGLIEPGRRECGYFTTFDPKYHGAPLAFVISKNLKRRHLNESQRAMVAARLANLGEGRPKQTASNDAVSQDAAAQLLNVSRPSVQRAKDVQRAAVPELVRAVDRGRLAVSAAAQAVRLTPDQQRRIAAEAETGRANVVRTMLKQELRAEREVELAEKQLASPQGKFGVLLVDWPRRHHVWSRDTGLDRSPDNHYPTQDFDWACGLPIAEWAAEDCLLVMCTTAASLLDDIEIAAEWGFCALRPRDGLGRLTRPNGKALPPVGGGTYRSHQVWDKVHRGTGRWFIDRHEMWLILVQGDIPCPAPGTQDESLFAEERGGHSAKPQRLFAWIERQWPNLRKLEVFRRGPPRPGWEAWGNEADEDEPHDPETGEILPRPNTEVPDPAGKEATPPGSAAFGAQFHKAADGAARTEATAVTAGETAVSFFAGNAGNDGGRTHRSCGPHPLRDEGLMLPDFLKRGADNRPPFAEAAP